MAAKTTISSRTLVARTSLARSENRGEMSNGRRRGAWVARLSLPQVIGTAAGLHVALAHFTHQFLTLPTGVAVICLAGGTSVGLATALTTREYQIGALAGGLIGEALFLATTNTPHSSAALMLSHALQVSIAFVGFVLLFSTRISKVPIPGKSFFGMTLCIVAAIIGALPVALPNESARFILEWGLGHGVGLFAITAFIASWRVTWFESVNPSNRTTELLVLLTLVFTVVALTIFVEPSFLLVALGFGLLLTSRYGVGVGNPMAVTMITIVAVASLQSGTQIDATDPANLFEVQAFALAMAMLTSTVGRLAFHSERLLRDRQDASDRWQRLATSGFDAYIELDANSTVVDASDTVGLLIGAPVEEIRGTSLRSFFDDAGWSKVAHFVRMVMAGQSVRFDRSFVAASGETRWVLSVTEPRMDDRGIFAGCTIFLLDTTATHRINSERAKSRSTLLQAQETERLRLAQLVHDGALQDLAAANLLVGKIMLDVEPCNPVRPCTIENIANIEKLLVSGMRKLRADAIGSAIIDLRDIEIVDALEQTVAKFDCLDSPAEVHIAAQRVDGASNEIARVIFQISQEALVNALLHSRANLVSVDLRRTRDGYSIAVIDDGVGFDTTQLQEVGHLGLSTMTALASEAGGWCSLSTRPAAGTSVEAWIPDTPTNDDAAVLQKRSAPHA